jgi:hypothetical protein
MVERTPLWFFLVLSSIGSASCHSTSARATPRYPDEIIGLYETGFEPRGFRFCDTAADGGIWRPVKLPKGVSAYDWPGTPRGMSAVLAYVRWRGGLAPLVKGGTGDARAVIVREILEVRAARRGDCGWSGR